MNILIVDDHTLVREGLKRIVADLPGETTIGEAADGCAALQRLEEASWDVVLLDIAMPGRGGVDTLRRIRDDYPDLPVLILSMYPEDQYALRMLKAGASGYLTKESAPERLLSAIDRISQGHRYISDTLAEQLAFQWELGGVERPVHEQLSDRELQVMRLLALGRETHEIADQLTLSPKTIATYRTRLQQKTGLRNVAEITRYALEHQLV